MSKITPLPEKAYEPYTKLIKIKAQKRELEAKLLALNTDQKLLEAEIITGSLTRKGTHQRLLPTGRILKVTRVDIAEQLIKPEDVGTVKRKGYSYFKLTETE